MRVLILVMFAMLFVTALVELADALEAQKKTDSIQQLINE